MPEEAKKSNTALFVDSKRVPIVEGNEVIVTADPYKEVTILENFPQRSVWGKVDKATGVPLTYNKVDSLPLGERGYLCRVTTEGVRPLVRGYDNDTGYRHIVVNAEYGPYFVFGVGVEIRRVVSQVSPSTLTLGELLNVLQKQ